MRDIKKIFLNFCLTVFVVIIFAAQSHAGKDLEKTRLPESLLPGIAHLLALADPAGQKDFDAVQIAPIIAFLKQSKHQDAIYYADKKTGSSSAKFNPKLLQDRGHWARMSKQEMQAVLAVEYMKSILGKTRKEEVAALF